MGESADEALKQADAAVRAQMQKAKLEEQKSEDTDAGASAEIGCGAPMCWIDPVVRGSRHG